MTSLHPNLASSARWHGKRVALAVAARDNARAEYERAWWRRMLSHYNASEQDAAREAFTAAYVRNLIDACVS